MNINNFLAAGSRATFGTLGAEPVTVGGEEVRAVVNIDSEGAGLDFGGGGDEMDTTIIIRTEQLSRRPKSGEDCEVRGQVWQIARVDWGEAVVTVTLEDQERA